jgi:hypothetical protein
MTAMGEWWGEWQRAVSGHKRYAGTSNEAGEQCRASDTHSQVQTYMLES